ncbi:MAG: TVP38/TMEM64 family protein [Miltoncostaeaceae bacterium]
MSTPPADPEAVPPGAAGPSPRARLVAAGVWVALVATGLVWARMQGLTFGEAAEGLVDTVRGSAWGPLLYVAVYLVRPLIFFSATVLTLAGGFLFGPVWGVVIVVIASNASAMIAYGLGRAVGGPALAAGQGRVARLATRMRRRSFESVVIMRLVFLPYDLVSYAAGAARINPLGFLAATALGSIAATVSVVLLGASLEEFDGAVPRISLPTLIISLVLLVGGLVVARIIRRREGMDDDRGGAGDVTGA